MSGPFKMKGIPSLTYGKQKPSPAPMYDSPAQKALVGDQNNLPEDLKAKIESSPGQYASPAKQASEKVSETVTTKLKPEGQVIPLGGKGKRTITNNMKPKKPFEPAKKLKMRQQLPKEREVLEASPAKQSKRNWLQKLTSKTSHGNKTVKVKKKKYVKPAKTTTPSYLDKVNKDHLANVKPKEVKVNPKKKKLSIQEANKRMS